MKMLNCFKLYCCRILLLFLSSARTVLVQWMPTCWQLCGASSTVRWCIYSCWDSVVL